MSASQSATGLPSKIAPILIGLAILVTSLPSYNGSSLTSGSVAPTAVGIPGPSWSDPAHAAARALPGGGQSASQLVARALGGSRLPQTAGDAQATDAPGTIANPLSVSRVQSAYRASDAVSGTLTITFTVTNNRRPAITPNVPLTSGNPISGTPSVTDTLAVIAATDYSKDPNIARDVILTDALAGSAAFVDGAPMPDRKGAQLVWNLGDIAPLASVTATLSISLPAVSASADYTNLDLGAGAFGMLQGRPVSARAAPAVLASDALDGQWLRSTVDANTTDRYMLAQAATLGQNPLREFAFVQGLGYESYRGSLRGTRGTLWSAAGNSLDKASLLIAMLRAGGIPSRYRHGTLDDATAQRLILSMFPAATRTVGYVPPGAPTSDPAHDATLLAESRDHWWVEAYLPGHGWQDLDPSFADAAVGQTYVASGSVATDGTDRIAEVPDAQRSKVTMRLKVETYAPATFTDSLLSYSYPLEHTFNTVELVGEPVTLQHLVHHNVVANGLLSVDLHQWTYTPYLVVAGKVLEGQSFDELRSFFPFATHLPTAEWLDFEVHDPNRHTYTDERTIVDSIGYAPRNGGGDVTGPAPAEGTFLNEASSYSTLFAPSAVPASAISADYQQLVQAIVAGQQADAQLQDFSNNGQINDQLPQYRQAVQTIQDVTRLTQRVHLLSFAALSDYGAMRLGNGLLVKPYTTSPRILMTSWEQNAVNGKDDILFDLRRDNVRVVGYPDQAYQGVVAFSVARGVLEMTLEADLMKQSGEALPQSVATIFQQAENQGIPLTSLTHLTLAQVNDLPLSADAKARISEELQLPQNLIIIPTKPVTLNGQPVIGWLISNMLTGQTVDEMESGQHQSLVEYAYTLNYAGNKLAAAYIGFLHGFSAYTFTFLGKILGLSNSTEDFKIVWKNARKEAKDLLGGEKDKGIGKIIGKAGQVLKDCSDLLLLFDKAAGTAADQTGDIIQSYALGTDAFPGYSFDFKELAIADNNLSALLKCAGSTSSTLGAILPQGRIELPFGYSVSVRVKGNGEVSFKLRFGGFVEGVNNADAALGSAVDPPLPTALLARAPAPPADAPVYMSGVLQASATLPNTSVQSTIVITGFEVSGGLTGRWAAESQNTNTVAFTQVTPLSGTLYDSDGSLLGTGSIMTRPRNSSTLATVVNSSVTSTLNGAGSTALYAIGANGLHAGSSWNPFTSSISATQPYTLALQNVVATINGTSTYTGSFTLVTSDPASFLGSGHTAVPNFSPAASYRMTDGQLTLGPATDGDFTVGGTSLGTSNGVALSSYDGPITVTSVSPTSERVELDGNASFFMLHAVPAGSTVVPGTPATFGARIDANADDTYTTTVEAPPNWTVALDATGAVTATPPLGTVPGDYAVRVSVQSSAHPDLVASAVHTVTVTPAQGVALDVAPDPQFTVPWGPGDPNASPGDTNDGRIQLTGAAFTVDVTNTSTVAHTFNLSVSGLPDGWTLLSTAVTPTNSASITLPSGGVGQVGLYISPTVTMLPPPGTVEPFTVHVAAADDGNSALTGSASQSFTVPAIAFSQISATPATVVSTAGLSATFQLAVRNVGNVAGTFPLSVTLPISDWTADITSPLTLDPGQGTTQTMTLQTPDGNLGQDYPVEIDSPSGGYTQSTTVLVHVTSPAAQAVDKAAQTAGTFFPDNLPLSAGLAYLGQTIESFQVACQHAVTMTVPGAAACSTDLRDHVISAVQQVATAVTTTSPLLTDGDAISDLARTIGATTTVSAVNAGIDTLQRQITALQGQLTEVARHGWQIGFTPGRHVVLQGKPATYGLRLTNTGSLTTTYALTLTTPSPSVALSPLTATVVVAPGSTITVPVTATTSLLGSAELQAEVGAVDALDLATRRAPAVLTAVDALLRVTGVRATPSFVEYGSGSASPQVVAQVANVADEPISGTARVRLLDASGTEVYSTTTSVELVDTLAPIDYPLGPITTTGLMTGTYTLAVDILDANGQIIPKASGQGMLGVGQAVTAGSSVTPSLAPPGDVTATTSLTAALNLNAPIFHPSASGGASAGARITPSFAHATTVRRPVVAAHPLAPRHPPVGVTAVVRPRTRSSQSTAGYPDSYLRHTPSANSVAHAGIRSRPAGAANSTAGRPTKLGRVSQVRHPARTVSTRLHRTQARTSTADSRLVISVSMIFASYGAMLFHNFESSANPRLHATATLARARIAHPGATSTAAQTPRAWPHSTITREPSPAAVPTPAAVPPASHLATSPRPDALDTAATAEASAIAASTIIRFVVNNTVEQTPSVRQSRTNSSSQHTYSNPYTSYRHALSSPGRWVRMGGETLHVSPAVRQETDTCGTITADTHWTLSNSPYMLTCYVQVSTGVTLTIDPGVVVEGSGNVGLYVQGTLLAQGTTNQPITFTSAASPAVPGDWTGLFFDGVGASGSVLSHVTVADAGRAYAYDPGGYDYHGGWGGWLCAEAGRLGANTGGANGHDCDNAAVLLRGSSPAFDHLSVQNSQTDGLYALADAPPLQLSHASFVGNGGYAIHLQNIASLPTQPGTLDLSNSSLALDGGTLAGPSTVSATQGLTYTLLGYPTVAARHTRPCSRQRRPG